MSNTVAKKIRWHFTSLYSEQDPVSTGLSPTNTIFFHLWLLTTSIWEGSLIYTSFSQIASASYNSLILDLSRHILWLVLDLTPDSNQKPHWLRLPWTELTDVHRARHASTKALPPPPLVLSTPCTAKFIFPKHNYSYITLLMKASKKFPDCSLVQTLFLPFFWDKE